MKCRILFLLLLFLFFNLTHFFAQTGEFKDIELKDVVITMRQEYCCHHEPFIYPYTVTIRGDRSVTFEGVDAGEIVNPRLYRKEKNVKVTKENALTKEQLRELVHSFYEAGFFNFEHSFQSARIQDGDSIVITSITLNGETKILENYASPRDEMVELQKKIYEIGNVNYYVTEPPYWLPADQNKRSADDVSLEESFRNIGKPQPVIYRKVRKPAPKDKPGGKIDLDEKWGFLSPCVSTREEVVKKFGAPIAPYVPGNLIPYEAENVQIIVLDSNGKSESRRCGGVFPEGTVLQYEILPLEDTKLSDLKIDVSKYEKMSSPKRENWYRNLEQGKYIKTEIMEFSDKTKAEMVTGITFMPKFKE